MASGAETKEAIPDRENATQYKAPRANLALSDFTIQGHIGDGSFSTVVLAQRKGALTAEQHAIKIVNKHLVLRNKMVEYIKNERLILDKLDYDGIVKLSFTFQDADSLYFGLEHCGGGDLYEQISKSKKLPLETARFYAAEIVLILEYLRSKEVVHRDLKPENLLLTDEGHLKLIDFGSAKAFFLPAAPAAGARARATSFVGTAEYVSPEVLNNQPLSYPADLWALGCILYQMIVGQPPFKGGSEYLTFQMVADRELTFPEDFPEAAKDLVNKLLAMDPEERLGATDMEELRQHDYFNPIEWSNLRQQQAPEFTRPVRRSPEEEALDWELTSLMTKSEGLHGGIVYERNPEAGDQESSSDSES